MGKEIEGEEEEEKSHRGKCTAHSIFPPITTSQVRRLPVV